MTGSTEQVQDKRKGDAKAEASDKAVAEAGSALVARWCSIRMVASFNAEAKLYDDACAGVDRIQLVERKKA